MAAVVFAAMLALNCLTPYVADDYTFSFSYATGERLTGLWSVLESQWYHYFHWSGRFIIKCLAQGFTILPKAVFNLLNAAVYAGLGLVLHRLALGQRRRFDPAVLALIYLNLWMVSPVFGQTNLWMCGSVNYLWATFFCMAALVPYALYLNRAFAPRRWLRPPACWAALWPAGPARTPAPGCWWRWCSALVPSFGGTKKRPSGPGWALRARWRALRC